MGAYTASLGGGVADTGVSYKTSFISTSDLVSPWNPTDTPNSGAFDSTGITASTVKPARVTTIRLRLGGTSVDGSGNPVYGNADPYIQLATQIDGGGGYTDDTIHHLTSSMITASTGTVNWAIDTNTTYYYGVRGSTGTGSTLTFARGGSNGGIYFNGTLQSDFSNDGISGDVTVQHIPSAPGAPSASNIGTTSLTLTWTAPTDDGMQNPAAYSATNINGYRINYKANAASAWSVLVANTGSNALSRTITTGLEKNTKYDFQVAALNDVTDAHNTSYSSITAHVGSRSSTGVATTLTGGPKIWTGVGTGVDGWSQSEIKVWTGVGTGVNGWTTGSTMKVWTGVGTGVDGWTNIT